MSGESKFRRNIVIVAAFHALVLAGLLFFTGGEKKPAETPTWLDGGSPPAGAPGEEAAGKQEEQTPEPTATPEPPPKPSQEKVEPAQPTPTEAASEIVLPTPSATPVPTATPKPTPEPTPTPLV